MIKQIVRSLNSVTRGCPIKLHRIAKWLVGFPHITRRCHISFVESLNREPFPIQCRCHYKPKPSSIYLVQWAKSSPWTSPQVKAAAFIARTATKDSVKFRLVFFSVHTLNKMSISSPWPINSLILNIIPLLVRLCVNIIINFWPQLRYIHSYC
jgi:hypothetical protein